MSTSPYATALKQQRDMNYSYVGHESVSQDMQGICELMKRQAWKSVVILGQKLMMSSKKPHVKLHFRLTCLISLFKLGRLDYLTSEFRDIGSFDSKKNIYESYPEFYPNRTGSMVPFTMRLIYAQLPILSDKDPKLDSLFALLNFCEDNHSKPNSISVISEGFGAHYLWLLNHCSTTMFLSPSYSFPEISFNEDAIFPEQTCSWKTLFNLVQLIIISYMMKSKQYDQAIPLINKVYNDYPTDIETLNIIGKIYYEMGQVIATETVFSKIESIICNNFQVESYIKLISVSNQQQESGTNGNDNNNNKNHNHDNNNNVKLKDAIRIVFMNRGLLNIVKQDFVQARDNFKQAYEHTDSIPSLVNFAICELYSGNLMESIELLESMLKKDVKQCVDETFVFNLSTLYELAWSSSTSYKEKLFNQLLPYLPDNFNLTSFKL